MKHLMLVCLIASAFSCNQAITGIHDVLRNTMHDVIRNSMNMVHESGQDENSGAVYHSEISYPGGLGVEGVGLELNSVSPAHYVQDHNTQSVETIPDVELIRTPFGFRSLDTNVQQPVMNIMRNFLHVKLDDIKDEPVKEHAEIDNSDDDTDSENANAFIKAVLLDTKRRIQLTNNGSTKSNSLYDEAKANVTALLAALNSAIPSYVHRIRCPSKRRVVQNASKKLRKLAVFLTSIDSRYKDFSAALINDINNQKLFLSERYAFVHDRKMKSVESMKTIPSSDFKSSTERLVDAIKNSIKSYDTGLTVCVNKVSSDILQPFEEKFINEYQRCFTDLLLLTNFLQNCIADTDCKKDCSINVDTAFQHLEFVQYNLKKACESDVPPCDFFKRSYCVFSLNTEFKKSQKTFDDDWYQSLCTLMNEIH